MNAIYELILYVFNQLYSHLVMGFDLIPLMQVELIIHQTSITISSIIASMIVILIVYYVAFVPIKIITTIVKRLVRFND